MTEPQFVLFVSAVEGHAVSRYGSGARDRRPTTIGAVRGPDGFTWNTAEVVALTQDEMNRFSKEYRGAILDGALIQRTEDDWRAWIAEQSKKAEASVAPKTTPETKAKKVAAPPQE